MLMGVLSSQTIRQKEHFSFEYDPQWLKSSYAQSIDPDLALYSGMQHARQSNNFGVFLDSCPDRWGRLLLNRRAALKAKEIQERTRKLGEMDYLLGVHDLHRMGGLRFKQDAQGPFLDNDPSHSAPPIAALDELQRAALHMEADEDSPKVTNEWLRLLLAPGSSLGGARPKASVVDTQGDLWIAKFPSRFDEIDVAAWEFVVYQLALKAGVTMPPSQLIKVSGRHRTFLSKRFDRLQKNRLHFSSAMTQLGYRDGEDQASYLELAEFLTQQGASTQDDLAQLWRRIVFSIAVSNADDHLRNHGFLLSPEGWRLSPAYDLNPVPTAESLHLNISDTDGTLSFNLAMDVIDFFQLRKNDAETIRNHVVSSVTDWTAVAKSVGISRAEQQRMAPAFRV
jgi:serine/threonine-protein kinase HipA